MRIISFSKHWQKLANPEFTTFRFPRKDKDWFKGEIVQVFYKSRSPQREKLGTAEIISKETKTIGSITILEAIADGFNNDFEMWRFLGKPNMNRTINKLTLR